MMYNNVNKLKNIEIPENLFSNLGESKKTKITPIEEPLIEEKEIIEEPKKEISDYRRRITNMYEKLDDLTPINNEINDTLFFNNYVEKGIVIKPKISSLKQFWTEYRLIRNEKTRPKNSIDIKDETLVEPSNFDELFNALSDRVTETSNKLQQDTKDLKEEKQKFMDYKKEEEEKIAKEKESLKNNYDRLQNIINDLDRKLNEIEK